MSNEGGLVNVKHGGPQCSTHVPGLDVNIDLPDAFSIKNELLTEDQLVEHQKGIQNGDNLQFLSSPSDVDLDSYERAVVENNTEWLKSRCRNIEAIDFDIPTSGNDGIELFGTSLSDTTDLPLCAEGSVLPLETSSLLLGGTNGSLLSTASSGGISGSNSSMASIFSQSQSTGCSTSISEKDVSIFEDKNNMLMTSQELESMPDRGLEFEASVGPKSSNSDIFSKSTTDITSSVSLLKSKTQQVTKLAQSVGASNSAITVTNSKLNVVQVQQPMNMHTVAPTSLTSGTLQIVPNQLITIQNPKTGGNSDKQAPEIKFVPVQNTTQILVNTSQGQQLLHINSNQLPGSDSMTRLVPVNQMAKNVDNSKAQPIQTGFLILPANPGGSTILTTNSGEAGGQTMINVDNSITKPPMFLKNPTGGPHKWVYMYLCTHPGCDKIFRKLSKMRIHLMSHTGERPFKCSKPGCDWAFTTCYKLKRHEESHQGRKDFQCDYPDCGKRFATSYNLKSHKKSHEKPCEPCLEPGCNMKFPNRRQLNLHMKTHNGSEKKYKCPVDGCDKTFFSPHCMGSHPRTHQQDRDFRCNYEGCTKVYSTACRLKQHMRSHTGEKPFVCYFENCGWAFTTASKLRRHQAKHTGLRKWKCPVENCGRAFMRSEHLKGHMITHSGKKPFSCPVEGCTAKFVAKTSLKVHMNRHENQKVEKIAYHCPIEGCMKKYFLKSKLREHMVQKHLSSISSNGQVTQLDLEPLLGGELQDIGMMTSNTDAKTVIQTVQINNPGGSQNLEQSVQATEPKTTMAMLTIPASEQMTIDPLEFITNPADSSGEIPQISQAVLNQLMSGLEKPEPTTNQTAPHTQSMAGPVVLENNSGSARTDYLSNHNLSYRARQRRQLLKEKTSTAVESQDYTDQENSEESLLAQASSVFLSPEEAPSFSASADHVTFSPPADSLSSRGITFRDPETGVMYVQTQLLQDDPPSTVTDLYSDEQVLGSEISDLTDNSSTSLDQSIQDSEFTGSTINFQDLH
ncbi:zinc finger protein 292-like [Saccostrea echinata]|uniref:zinc finger protein 292-like n=1 Tax=Saccostrea echinata TaxID=191078 RepID=UPI002A819B94|nr:zinc finger protein 292-like [Saccostrea echinata]